MEEKPSYNSPFHTFWKRRSQVYLSHYIYIVNKVTDTSTVNPTEEYQR